MISGRKTRTILSLADKKSLFADIDKKVPTKTILKVYNISAPGFYKLKRERHKFKDAISSSTSTTKSKAKREKSPDTSDAQSCRTTTYPKMDDALYLWLIQKRQSREEITYELLAEKANVFFDKIYGAGDFRATRGYLRRLLGRCNTHHAKITGEFLLGDTVQLQFHYPEEETMYNILDDTEIVEHVQRTSTDSPTPTIIDGNKSGDEDDDEEEEEGESDEAEEGTVSEKDALKALETYITWGEQNSLPTLKLDMLSQMRAELLDIIGDE